MTDATASVAVIGGSGLYRLFYPAESTSRRIDTPHGPADVTIDELSVELVFARLAEAQPRIIRAIDAIIRVLPDDYAGRELIASSEVDTVLARGANG